ncbi:MAG: hypothetical protein B0D91_11695 [Oceanospirillales bacterium LUC14_002_19_P2]|nr:MAG: hypothetical protein B0D91_11695 [Oceanospirillales bacterium LUC14_002_19_P2]
MKGRTFPLPTLLSISVVAAVGGSGYVSPVLALSSPVGYTAAWQCMSTINEDWRCSPGPGQPYTLTLAEVKELRSEIANSLANLTLKETNPRHPAVDPTEKILALKKYEEHPMRSLAEQDWVDRLTTASSWPEDQNLVPEPDLPAPSAGEISEDEVQNSILLSQWLKRAKKRSSWKEAEEPEAVSHLDDTRLLHNLVDNSRETYEEQKQAAKSGEQDLSADKWLDKATARSSLTESDDHDHKLALSARDKEVKTSGILSGLQPGPVYPQKTITSPDSLLPPGMVQSAPIVRNPYTVAKQLTQQQAQPAQPAPQPVQVAQSQPVSPPKPIGVGGQLLVRQATGQPPVPQGYVPTPEPMPAPASAPAYATAQTISQPLPPLPDVEVTPAEREARAVRPSVASQPQRRMPYGMDMPPDRWRYAPHNTLPPKAEHPLASAPQRRSDPRNVNVPGGVEQQLQQPHYSYKSGVNATLSPPQSAGNYQPSMPAQPNNAVPNGQTSWSLTGQPVATYAPAPRQAPAPQQNVQQQIAQQPYRYRADERLAPSLPKYSTEPSWPQAAAEDIPKQKPDNAYSRMKQFNRPPPISPNDIFKLASSAPEAKQSAPEAKRKPEQPSTPVNSIERFRQKTADPDPIRSPYQSSAPQQPANDHYRQSPDDAYNRFTGNSRTNTQPATHNAYASNPYSGGAVQPVSFNRQSTATGPAALDQFLKAPRNHLTIQWLATTQPAKIMRLQQRFPALQDASVVRFRRQGQTWHILLTGIYPNKHSASQLLNQEPWKHIARALNPWTRSLAGIHKLDLVMPNTMRTTPGVGQAPAALPQGDYTIQWAIAQTAGEIREIQARYPQLSGAEAIEIPRRGGSSYALVQGRYRDNLTAMDALRQPRMAMLANDLRPVTRPMASIRNSRPLPQAVFSHMSIPMDDSIQRLMQAPDGTYTIQWLAANKPDVLADLQYRYPELNDAVTVRFRRNDRDWYVLVQGQFPNSRAAQQALQKPGMRELANKLNPWTRSVASLRNAIGS